MRRVSSLLVAALFACGAPAEANETNDPWQPLNLRVFALNEFADGYVLKPLAQAYRWVLPDAVERGIHNALENLDEPGVALNQLLQGKPALAASDAGRFLLNSTVGLGGILDVATPLGLVHHEEDFGQTLVVWGVPRGPFLTLPLLGPSTPAAAIGSAVDMFTQPTMWFGAQSTRYVASSLDVLDTRVQLLEAETLISGDRYAFLRDAYLQRREYLEADGEVSDPFLDDAEFEDEPADEGDSGAGAMDASDAAADSSADAMASDANVEPADESISDSGGEPATDLSHDAAPNPVDVATPAEASDADAP